MRPTPVRVQQPLRLPGPSPHLPLEGALTRRTLIVIQSLLRKANLGAFNERSRHQPEWKSAATAAVLIPLCNVNGRGGLLLQVRGKLRMHSGEVSFPGGKVDEADGSTLNAALRETWEELGIANEQVEILADMDAWREYSSSGLGVTPYTAFISPPQPKKRQDISSDSPLPSINLSSLCLSSTEVAHAFHLPFQDLLDASRLRAHLFRNLRPYWAVDVTDKVNGAVDIDSKVADGVSGHSSDKEKQLEVWGLTGWYLSLFMRTIGCW